MKKTVIIAAALGVALTAAAQPGNQKKAFPGPPPGDRQQMTVEERAQKKTDAMAAELSLTEDQVKALYEFNKEDMEYREQNFRGPRLEFDGPRPEPGKKPKGKFDKGPRPEGMDFEKMKEYNDQQEAKLKEIIGEENFAKWQEKHPQGGPRPPRPMK